MHIAASAVSLSAADTGPRRSLSLQAAAFTPQEPGLSFCKDLAVLFLSLCLIEACCEVVGALPRLPAEGCSGLTSLVPDAKSDLAVKQHCTQQQTYPCTVTMQEVGVYFHEASWTCKSV